MLLGALGHLVPERLDTNLVKEMGDPTRLMSVFLELHLPCVGWGSTVTSGSRRPRCVPEWDAGSVTQVPFGLPLFRHRRHIRNLDPSS